VINATAARARVTLIVFPGGFNWPVWAAEERGFFACHGIDVEVLTTPGSVFQWTALADGRAQIAITLMDNVVAYREGQTAAGIVVPDAVAVMGLDTRAMPTLVTRPTIRSYQQLEGATLAVDALDTGNALVLMALLEHGGLRPGDYRLESAGGVTRRFEAMQHGHYAGSLFNAPMDALLRRQGFTALDTARSVLDHFQGHVVAVRKAWAEANRVVVVGFVRALCDALAWLYDPVNRAEAFALYNRRMPGAVAGSDAAAYAVLFDPVAGFPPDGDVDRQGIDAVVRLRARYGQPRKPLRESAAYHDPSVLVEARVLA